jgi:hypothetical protein
MRLSLDLVHLIESNSPATATSAIGQALRSGISQAFVRAGQATTQEVRKPGVNYCFTYTPGK